jgi:D-alanine-D-alanine ligase
MKKLFILSGGPGREREVSLSSGRNIMETLSKEGIEFQHIVINENRGWEYGDKILSEQDGLSLLKDNHALVFQVIHGTYGEDGTLATLLEENGIACIGSTSEAMRLTIDKYKTENRLKENNISTTESVLVENISDIENVQVTFPAFVKPKDEGSSISLFKVKNEIELRDALEKSVPIYGAMLVQPFVAGRELTCGVIEIEGKAKALIPTEIILTKGETFDYDAKYSVGGSKEITPAEVDEETTKKIQDLALRVHTICGCKDISRTDMILREDGELVVLEINTIPGMTKTSFIPAQLEASGYSLSGFVKGMLEKYSK